MAFLVLWPISPSFCLILYPLLLYHLSSLSHLISCALFLFLLSSHLSPLLSPVLFCLGSTLQPVSSSLLSSSRLFFFFLLIFFPPSSFFLLMFYSPLLVILPRTPHFLRLISHSPPLHVFFSPPIHLSPHCSVFLPSHRNRIKTPAADTKGCSSIMSFDCHPSKLCITSKCTFGNIYKTRIWYPPFVLPQSLISYNITKCHDVSVTAEQWTW